MMNPVEPQNSKWEEIRKHGLFGRQLEPVFHSKMGKLLALALGVPLLGISLYWMFTYSGPYRYLAELQLQWLGSYSPELTYLLVILGLLFGFLGIAVAIKLLFRGAERAVPGMPTAPIATAATAPLAIPEPAIQVVERWKRNVRYAFLYAAPLVLFGIGAYSYYNGTHEGNLQQLSAADFEGGKPQARLVFAEVRGHLNDFRLIDENYYLYVPMTSAAGIIGPVHILAGIQENEMSKYAHREANGTFTVRGIVDKALGGDVKYAFEKNGIAVADPVWVVHAGRDPSWDKQMGLIMMGLGIALAGFVFGWQSYRKRKRAAAQAAQATA